MPLIPKAEKHILNDVFTCSDFWEQCTGIHDHIFVVFVKQERKSPVVILFKSSNHEIVINI